MQTLIIPVPTDRITDWDSFHAVFADCLGFPDDYGANMNAWIDCLTFADDAEAGMVLSFRATKGEAAHELAERWRKFERIMIGRYHPLNHAELPTWISRKRPRSRQR